MRYIIILIFTSFLQTGWSVGSSVSDADTYRNACHKEVRDDRFFELFKRDIHYTPILEHVTYEQGIHYLSIACRQSPQFVPLFEACKKNDLLGSPLTFNYETYGEFSPTTLRYIKVASDLNIQFGSLDDLNIVEIGGGYGGQCLILSTLFKVKKYTIIDLPEPLSLARKYLTMHGITNVEFLTPQEVVENKSGYDLVVSNYAFSECIARWQLKYTKDVLQHCTRGYLTCNSEHFLCAGVLSIKELEDLFAIFKLETEQVPEEPLTAPDNCIFIWNKNSIKREQSG